MTLVRTARGEKVTVEAAGNPDIEVLVQAAAKRLGQELLRRELVMVETRGDNIGGGTLVVSLSVVAGRP